MGFFKLKKIIDFLGANVRLRIFEKSSQMQHLIDSFNINTNAWVMHYVYKRLRFLQSKMLSQTGALVGSDCTKYLYYLIFIFSRLAHVVAWMFNPISLLDFLDLWARFLQ